MKSYSRQHIPEQTQQSWHMRPKVSHEILGRQVVGVRRLGGRQPGTAFAQGGFGVELVAPDNQDNNNSFRDGDDKVLPPHATNRAADEAFIITASIPVE